MYNRANDLPFFSFIIRIFNKKALVRFYHIIYLFSLSVFVVCSQKSFGQIEFIQNKGQWHNNVQYKAEVSAGSLYLEKNGFTIFAAKCR